MKTLAFFLLSLFFFASNIYSQDKITLQQADAIANQMAEDEILTPKGAASLKQWLRGIFEESMRNTAIYEMWLADSTLSRVNDHYGESILLFLHVLSRAEPIFELPYQDFEGDLFISYIGSAWKKRLSFNKAGSQKKAVEAAFRWLEYLESKNLIADHLGGQLEKRLTNLQGSNDRKTSEASFLDDDLFGQDFWQEIAQRIIYSKDLASAVYSQKSNLDALFQEGFFSKNAYQKLQKRLKAGEYLSDYAFFKEAEGAYTFRLNDLFKLALSEKKQLRIFLQKLQLGLGEDWEMGDISYDNRSGTLYPSLFIQLGKRTYYTQYLRGFNEYIEEETSVKLESINDLFRLDFLVSQTRFIQAYFSDENRIERLLFIPDKKGELGTQSKRYVALLITKKQLHTYRQYKNDTLDEELCDFYFTEAYDSILHNRNRIEEQALCPKLSAEKEAAFIAKNREHIRYPFGYIDETLSLDPWDLYVIWDIDYESDDTTSIRDIKRGIKQYFSGLSSKTNSIFKAGPLSPSLLDSLQRNAYPVTIPYRYNGVSHAFYFKSHVDSRKPEVIFHQLNMAIKDSGLQVYSCSLGGYYLLKPKQVLFLKAVASGSKLELL